MPDYQFTPEIQENGIEKYKLAYELHQEVLERLIEREKRVKRNSAERFIIKRNKESL